MTFSLFFTLSALFVFCAAMMAFSNWAGFRVVGLALSFLVAFYGLDFTMGKAKPTNVPTWSQPLYGETGATVLGAQIDESGAYLLLREEGRQEPRLFYFSLDSQLMQDLKKAMQQSAEMQNGNPYGFKIKPGMKPGGQGKGNGEAEGGGKGGIKGDEKSNEKGGYDTFTFEPPGVSAGPPKTRQGDGYREYKAPTKA